MKFFSNLVNIVPLVVLGAAGVMAQSSDAVISAIEAFTSTSSNLATVVNDLNVVNWTQDGVGMYQDALWANSDKLASDKAYQDQTVKVIQGVLKGWIYARDNPEKAATDVVAAGSQLGASHQLWQTNEVNKLIWPSASGGIGMISDVAWSRTVGIAKGTKNETGATIISADPPETAKNTAYVEKALSELKAEGVDVEGKGFTPVTVNLEKGGA